MARKKKDKAWLTVEKDVKRIQEFLHPGDAVTHNDLVRDKDGGNRRQVDITVRDSITGTIKRASECRNRADRQGSPWVEEAQGKRRSLQAEQMTLVSTSGFSLPAQKKAEALTLEGVPIELVAFQDVVGELVRKLHPKPISVRFFDELNFQVELGTIPPKLPFPSTFDSNQLYFRNTKSGDEFLPASLVVHLLGRKEGGYLQLPRNIEFTFNLRMIEGAVSDLKAIAPSLDWPLRFVNFSGSAFYREVEIQAPTRIRYYRINETGEILAAIARFEFVLGNREGAFEMLHLPHSVVQLQIERALGHQEVTFSPVDWSVLTSSIPPIGRSESVEED